MKHIENIFQNDLNFLFLKLKFARFEYEKMQ